jgi:acyl-CoA thioesterase II
VFESLMRLTPTGVDTFSAPPAPEPTGRVFGGQFLAHALMAAYQTVDDDRFVHSLHGFFLRAGSVDEPTEMVVDRARDGRSFSVRRVVARQAGVEMFTAQLSFHVPEDGPHYAGAVMPAVAGPSDGLLNYNDITRGQRAGLVDDVWSGEVRPIETLYVNPPTAGEGESVTESQLMWNRIRVEGRLPDDRRLHDVGLAYVSDATLVDHVHLPHGRRWQDPRASGASLDHSMWFHRPARADDWLLFDQSVESTGGNRGLASGRFYTETGDLVATCMQEGLMRWTDES